MKLLFDENLSPELVVRIFPNSLLLELGLNKAQTPEVLANFSPGLDLPTLGSWCVEYSTLKAFANTFGVDSVTVVVIPRVEATLGWNL